jgi:two-component system NtrC family sensor kinase
MASIGQLAAGMAHEINNSMGFIFSNLGTLSEYVEDIIVLLETYKSLEESIAKSDIGNAQAQLTKLK